MRWLQQNSKTKFTMHMGAKEEGVQDFWEGLKSSAQGRSFWSMHPWLRGKEPASLRWHLPLMVFEDAGPVSQTQSSMVRIWYSALSNGNERLTRFLISSYYKNDSRTDRSWEPVLQNFEELAGVQPPGIWGGVLLFVGGDMGHLCNTIGLPHYNGTEICCLCLANDSTRPWNNFHETAAWRDTLVTNDQFLARLRRPLHPLAAHPIFNLHSYRHDLLHMIDVHGVAIAIIANILRVHISPGRWCSERDWDRREGVDTGRGHSSRRRRP